MTKSTEDFIEKIVFFYVPAICKRNIGAYRLHLDIFSRNCVYLYYFLLLDN